jgi:hypothetical protein
MATPKKNTPPPSPKPHMQGSKDLAAAHKNDPVVATETPSLDLGKP